MGVGVIGVVIDVTIAPLIEGTRLIPESIDRGIVADH